MSYVTFDGVDVVADFTFTGSNVCFAVFAHSGFDFGFVFLVGFRDGCSDFVHYFDAYCGWDLLNEGYFLCFCDGMIEIIDGSINVLRKVNVLS